MLFIFNLLYGILDSHLLPLIADTSIVLFLTSFPSYFFFFYFCYFVRLYVYLYSLFFDPCCHLVLESILKLNLVNIDISLFADTYHPLISCLCKTHPLMYSSGKTPVYSIPWDLAHFRLFFCGLVTWMTGWLDIKCLVYSLFCDFLKKTFCGYLWYQPYFFTL